MKTLKRLAAGLLSLTLAAALAGGALAAEPKAAGAAGEPIKEEPSAPKSAGQFSRWFPDMGVNPENPEASEAVLASMGTVINQTKIVGDETLTLNAAVWNGSFIRLSLTGKSPDFPKDLDENFWLNADACTARIPEDQWKEHAKRKVACEAAGETQEARDEWFQYLMERGQGQMDLNPTLGVVSREGDTVQFVSSMNLDPYLENPEVTLHIENVVIRNQGAGGSILKGPFDFTFTLDKVVLPLNYAGSVKMTISEVPVRITSADVSPTSVSVVYAPESGSEEMVKEVSARVEGVWTKDGKYVDCSSSFAISGVMSTAEGKPMWSHLDRKYPYAMDPATVTAVKISGVRVELAGLELQTK